MSDQDRKIKKIIIAIVYGVLTMVIAFFFGLIFFPRRAQNLVPPAATASPIQILAYDQIDLGNGFVDYWAEISNPNDDKGLRALGYSFILKDSQGAIIKESGETFILPGDKKRYILLLNYPKGSSLQGFELAEVGQSQWASLSRFDLPELVVRNVYARISDKAGNPFTVGGVLTNRSEVNLKNIQVMAILTNEQDKVIGVNETIVRDILKSEARDFEMTWNEPVSGASLVNTTIYSQSNVLASQEILLELESGPVFD